MATATYRGVTYDTNAYRINELEIIKRKIEKARALHEADMVLTKKR